MIKALVNGRVFDGDQLHSSQAVVLEHNRVVALVPEHDIPEAVDVSWDLEGKILAPGLIDIQVNGGGGVMFNNAPTVETLGCIGAAHRRFGTAGFLPTLISSDSDTMQQAIEAVGQAIAEGVPGVLGIHLEGPFLNADKRGIHDADKFCSLDEAAFELLTSLKTGRTLVTIAPELTTTEMISRLSKHGVVVSGGHSSASYEQTREALQAGMRGFTHLFNAMSPFTSREPGMVGAALEDQHSWFGIIADGHHVHPASFAVAVAAKRKGGAVLVTDAMATVGSDSKTFKLDGAEIMSADGCCRTESGALAGSDLDMISAVRNALRFADIDYLEALRMASSYPAQALGLGDQLGFIRPGYKASFIELDDDLKLYRSWIDGEVST
jgi:N-acetylglucosamine-6-phosphate deacetylase